MIVRFMTATEAELAQLDRTRRTALHYRSAHGEGSPQRISRRFATIVRRAWAFAF